MFPYQGKNCWNVKRRKKNQLIIKVQVHKSEINKCPDTCNKDNPSHYRHLLQTTSSISNTIPLLISARRERERERENMEAYFRDRMEKDRKERYGTERNRTENIERKRQKRERISFIPSISKQCLSVTLIKKAVLSTNIVVSLFA